MPRSGLLDTSLIRVLYLVSHVTTSREKSKYPVLLKSMQCEPTPPMQAILNWRNCITASIMCIVQVGVIRIKTGGPVRRIEPATFAYCMGCQMSLVYCVPRNVSVVVHTILLRIFLWKGIWMNLEESGGFWRNLEDGRLSHEG